MIFTYDSTTGGAKRIDWDLTCSDLTKDEDKELETLIESQKTYTVFTSPSSFDSFIKNYNANKTNIISIGTTTSSYIKDKGHEPLITSKMQSYEGISESIIDFFLKEYDYEIS